MIATDGDIIKTKSCIYRKNGLDSSLTVVIASVELVNKTLRRHLLTIDTAELVTST